MDNSEINCSEAIVKILEHLGVTHVFGVPGAKIDSLFIALNHSNIKLVLVRHEQNAAFMAAAFGRITGKIGVCIATSGPGVTNLVTGLATATSEGDPVLAIGGEVSVNERLKKAHQSLDSVMLMKAVTKYSAEVVTPDQLGEIMGNAIRAAESGRQGAAFISLPKDVGLAPFTGTMDARWGKKVAQGPANLAALDAAAAMINASRRPMILFGMDASKPAYATAIKTFLDKTGIPYTSTFQGPGKWAKPQGQDSFAGRVGLFCNQPADKLLEQSDCILAIGYDAIEFEPSLWNKNNARNLIVLDVIPCAQDNAFLPTMELVGDIASSMELLLPKLSCDIARDFLEDTAAAFKENEMVSNEGLHLQATPVHPLRIIHELRQIITKDTHIALDIGSNYIWMSRYYGAEYARQVLVSNGQQTLGVALPWAIASCLLHPNSRVISISGDGGFLFSSMELETAKRLGVKFIHLIWDSRSYDMVSFQESAHYEGETAGVALGEYDIEHYAASFGCKGYTIKDAADLAGVLQEAVKVEVPVLINIPVDYSQNMKLMQNVIQSFVN